ncbi:MAG: hypothetical protein H6922_01470 [Pseudomonadaceae bacterium]|nr:hypothetical protein [Pseudomonadaceae bacterium]
MTDMTRFPNPPNHAQSGALFGLDARLALAIFAILTVMAGYVAYGRIGLAKTAALVSELQSINQALAAYQTDMGTFYLFTLDKAPDDTGATDLEALWDKSKLLPGFQHLWNGPYLHRETRQHPYFGRFTIFYGQSDRQTTCTIDSDCYVWLALTKVPANVWDDINKALDEDGGKQPEPADARTTSGLIQADAATDPRTLIYRTVSR